MIEPRDAAQRQPLEAGGQGAHGQWRQQQCPAVAQAKPVKQKPGHDGAQHVLGAVREVDDVEHAEDQRQAQAQHGVERSVDQADHQLSQQRVEREMCHVACSDRQKAAVHRQGRSRHV